MTPVVNNVAQAAIAIGRFSSPPPAGSVIVSGLSDPAAAITLSDTLANSTVLATTTASDAGTWFLGLSFYHASPLQAGLHDLVVSSSAGTSAPVRVSVGTSGGDLLAGLVLSDGISGPRHLFAGPGDDLITAYSIVPAANGGHAIGGAISIDGGSEAQGGGLDTVVTPTALSAVTSHHFAYVGGFSPNHLVFDTSDAHVGMTAVDRLRFTDVTLTVQEDRLTDFLYYDQRYPDLAAADVNARSHYVTFGWHEGRDPNAFFSTSGYVGAYSDVRGAELNPLDHYDLSGWTEGRDPSAAFDTKLYLRFNPDVAAARVDPLLHYLGTGLAEGRKMSPVVESTLVRDGFDPLYYKLANPDVGLSGMDPLLHYRTFGAREGRNPDAFFDADFYLAHNPDVATSGFDPLAHYNQFGWREGRDPSSHFGTSAYLAHDADVATAGLNPLQHFLQYGIQEGRSAYGDLF